MIDANMITTSVTLEGYKVNHSLGVVLGNIAGGLQSLIGGRLSVYVELCEKSREEAYQQMLQHAVQKGANAIINMRYDANEITDGITEVLAYGTAVVAEKLP